MSDLDPSRFRLMRASADLKIYVKPEDKKEDVIMDLAVGDVVTVLSGAWEGTVGAVQTINEQKKSLTINVELFGRETPVELGFSEVKKMD